jgi:SAM-dependent methyltransferase
MSQSYAIRGGRSGRERLRVLSNILQAGTNAFLDRLGIRPGMSCLDVGCGGGDVTRELARRAGSSGQIVGLDMDAAQVNIIACSITITQKTGTWMSYSPGVFVVPLLLWLAARCQPAFAIAGAFTASIFRHRALR